MHILVIGAGVSGLTCGILLCEAGFTVTIVAERRTPTTTSDRAGAVFTPFRAVGDERVRRWTRSSYQALCRLTGEFGAPAGLSMVRLREYCFARQPSAPWWADLVDDFRRLPPPPGYADVLEARMPRMAAGRYMPWLQRRFVQQGGALIEQHVANLDQAFALSAARAARASDPAIVVNCAGLGARQLAPDAAVRPMRGQVLHVVNDLGLEDCLVEEARASVGTYIFPIEDYLVLGGTYEVDQWQEQTDEPALADILERCRCLLRATGHPRWSELGGCRLRAVAGLRPGRIVGNVAESIRLESERIAPGRTVIHNYGHGRAGVTFSWGCGPEVVELVRAAAD